MLRQKYMSIIVFIFFQLVFYLGRAVVGRCQWEVVESTCSLRLRTRYLSTFLYPYLSLFILDACHFINTRAWQIFRVWSFFHTDWCIWNWLFVHQLFHLWVLFPFDLFCETFTIFTKTPFASQHEIALVYNCVILHLFDLASTCLHLVISSVDFITIVSSSLTRRCLLNLTMNTR